MAADKKQFVKELAQFLAGNQAEMSIRLAAGSIQAKQWAAIRTKTPLFGYPTVEEAEKELSEWLGIT